MIFQTLSYQYIFIYLRNIQIGQEEGVKDGI